MKTIYKYPLEVTGDQFVLIPSGYKILTVQVQNEVPCIWAEVDKSSKPENVHVVIVGTGQETREDDEMNYIGSFRLYSGSFVGHCFISK